MADSSITKQALALSLRSLMSEMPFDKIKIAFICERCSMKRQSFYYHFSDKYELVNWIFDTETTTIFQHNNIYNNNAWLILERICNYFYENRSFYRPVLQVKETNSLAVHFYQRLLIVFNSYFSYLSNEGGQREFFVNFMADAIVCSIIRWISNRNCMTAKDFTQNLRQLGEVVWSAKFRSALLDHPSQ